MRSRVISSLLALLALASLGFEWEGRLMRLRRELESGDPARRREVVRLLSSYSGDEVREPILAALSDGDAGVRAEAAEAAGAVRLRDAVPRLLDWLDDPDADVRASAARALGRIGEERAIPSLVRALGDVSSDVRKAAVQALAGVGTPEVVVPLLGRLDDVDSSVRVEAAEALGQLRDARAVVPLVGRARDDAPEVRVAVYGALGNLREGRALPALLQALRDESEMAQLAAIAAVGRLGDPSAVEPLIALREDPDPRRARAVIAALGGIGGETALEAVVSSLSRHQTRDVAAEVLGAMARRAQRDGTTQAPGTGGRAQVMRALAQALDEAESHLHATAVADVMVEVAGREPSPPAEAALLRAARLGHGGPAEVLRALAAVGSPDVLVPILERARSEEAPMRQAALEALALYFERHHADGRAADPLLAALGRVSPEQRVLVVRLLGEVGAARALPELRPLLEHDDPDLRLAAVQAIGAIGDAEGAAVLLSLLDDREPRTRFEAARAIESAASAETVAALVERLRSREPTDRHAVVLALGGALARLGAGGASRRTRARELGATPANAAATGTDAPANAEADADAEADANTRRGTNAHARSAPTLPPGVARLALAALADVARGPDDALAARAIDALGRSGDPRAVGPLTSLLAHVAPTRRRAAAYALAGIDDPRAVTALREALAASAPGNAAALPVAAAAAAGLGEHGTAADAPRLLEAARERPWPLSAAASFAIARLARRGRLDAAAPTGTSTRPSAGAAAAAPARERSGTLQEGLCDLARSRDAFVRANVATAMAALSAPPCGGAGAPAAWLDSRHAAVVRAAAARWLASAAEAGHVEPERARQALDTCRLTDPASEVAAVCDDPTMPPLDDEADVYAYSADGSRLRTDQLVALRLADGSVWVGRTDLMGHVRLANAPRGRLLLDDPVGTPLEP